MAEHMTIQEAFGMDAEELAKKVGNLRYDELSEFFKKLTVKLHADAYADRGRGREKLANELNKIAERTHGADLHARIAWQISEPHM